MTGPSTPVPGPAVDTLRVATTFSVLAGVLSTVFAYFDGLTAALAALVMAAWITRRPPPNPVGWTPRYPSLVAGSVYAGGWAAFIAGPVPFHALRGLALGLSAVPLWWWFRTSPLSPGGDG